MHKIYWAFCLLLILIYYSCDILSEDYRDISYFTPCFLPDNQNIVLLKNIHEYTETGTPGGTIHENSSSEWFLFTYNIISGSGSEKRINQFTEGQFWLDKGITSASDSFLTIVNRYDEYLMNIHSLEITVLPEELDILGAYIDQNNQQVILLEGFYSFYLKSYDVQSGSVSTIFELNDYFGNLATSYIPDAHRFIVWNNYGSTQEVAIVNLYNSTIKISSDTAVFVNIYDNDKAALLKTEKEFNTYSFLADSLIRESSTALGSNQAINFSISHSGDFIVYQTLDISHSGKIVLKDLHNNSEKTIFRNQHKTR